MKILRRSFSGGYRFARFEGQPADDVMTAEMPARVILPLQQGFGREVPALVKRGDVVKAGQIIGRDDETISSPLHASVNGTVEAVKSFNYFGKKVRAVFITPDETTEWQAVEGASANWPELPVEKLENVLYLSGVTALGSSGIPTRYKSSIIAPSEVQHLIIHYTESDVFNVPLSLLLKEEGLQHFLEGVKILQTLLSGAKTHIAMSSRQAEWLFEIADSLHDQEAVSFYTLKPKYPQHRDEVLVSTILREKIPFSYIPANLGVLTFTVQDVLRVYDAVVQGKPFIDTLMTLAGPGFTQRGSV
ncbi:hypothetical protein GF339_19015, partial [candidate division KSB3 bacterium]|nr:hypothetical protein [candidate division KSB3 bacterium]MBD3326683.1 hypothetical protein [candidate division KSB3 bacterium]